MRKNVGTLMFLAAELFMVAKPCRQPERPSVSAWAKKVLFLYTMQAIGYYSPTRRKGT